MPAPEKHCAAELEALVDTRAMMVVLGVKEVERLGVRMNDQLPTTVMIQVANGEVVRLFVCFTW